jgi:hypothetical protein
MRIFADIREKLGELNLLKVRAEGELLPFLTSFTGLLKLTGQRGSGAA